MNPPPVLRQMQALAHVIPRRSAAGKNVRPIEGLWFALARQLLGLPAKGAK